MEDNLKARVLICEEPKQDENTEISSITTKDTSLKAPNTGVEINAFSALEAITVIVAIGVASYFAVKK